MLQRCRRAFRLRTRRNRRGRRHHGHTVGVDRLRNAGICADSADLFLVELVRAMQRAHSPLLGCLVAVKSLSSVRVGKNGIAKLTHFDRENVALVLQNQFSVTARLAKCPTTRAAMALEYSLLICQIKAKLGVTFRTRSL